MNQEALDQEKDIRRQVKGEYDALVQNLFDSAFALKMKFDEFGWVECTFIWYISYDKGTNYTLTQIMIYHINLQLRVDDNLAINHSQI